MEPIRDKPRNGGRETRPDSYDRTRDRGRLPATRGKDDEVDWRNREKRKYADRRPNGRASLAEQVDYEEQENGRRKGDTFPRMTKPTKDRDGRILLPVHEREGEYRMGIPKEMLYEFERERERERRRYRDVDTQSERERARYKEDLRRNDMRRPVKDESERRRDREKEFDSGMKDGRRESSSSVNDQWGIKERERDRRYRGDERYRQKDREGRYHLRETESFSDREWRVERPRDTDRDKKRYTKSEGDSDEERGKDKRRKDDYNGDHKHCKSEGDSEAQRIAERIRERDRRRDANRQRETGSQDRKGERLEHYREPERDRTRDSREKTRDYFDRDAYTYATERRRYKNEEKTRYLERAEMEEREKRRRENREKDRPREERTSGGDVENEKRRGIIEKFEERESQITSDIDKQKVEVKTEKELEGTSVPRKEEEVGSVAVKEMNTDKPKSRFRKMWLEPRSLKERKDEEEYIEREKAKERYLQRYKANTTTAEVEEHEREKDREKIVSLEDRYRELEKAGEFVRYASAEQEKEKITHDKEAMEPERENVEEIDKEETSGNGRYDYIGNEEGSEGESEGDKDRVMSTDDGFVTVSSGGDDAEEDDFEDCKEFWDGGVGDDQSKCMQEEMTSQTVNESEDQKEPLTVFCVIGQTLPRSQAKPAFEDNTDEEATYQLSDQDLDNQGEVNVTNINEASENIEIGMDDLTLSQTEDGCDTKWEGRGSYEQPTQDVRSLDDQMIPPNEISEKDTQSVPPELLESSEPCNYNAIVATETSSESLLKGSIGDTLEIINSDDNSYTSEERKRCSTAPHLKWAKDVVKEILGPDVTADKENTRGSLTHTDMQSNTQTEVKADTDDSGDEKEPIEGEVEQQGGMETESNEGSEDDLLDPHYPVKYTLSSEGETESERGELVTKKTDRIKEVVLSSNSFRDLGNEARIRRRGFRKTTEKHKEGEEEEGGVARDRRTRVFNTSDEDDDELCFTWSEVDLRKVSETLSRTKKRNSKFFNSQLYQEYSEVVQNREIQLSHSDSIAISGDPTHIRSSSSPNHSPKFAHRALPPPPPVPLHPYTLSQNNKSLNVPQQSINRPPSPRLSISPSSPTLWQDLPGVRSSAELGEVTEDERRLQEVRFEVVTSEASYSRSLDIVVDNFVLSKQLKSLLSAQDKNCLFSKLSDVRDVSQSFLSKLEERVESDVMHFSVCDIIINFCPQFRKVYVPYLTNQSYQDKTYQRLMDGNHEFRRVVEKLERNPVCQRLPLRSFLILPFQRITRLKLLVQNIAKRTAPKTKDEAQAIKAMKMLEKMIQESNESISQMSNIESLVTLNAKVDFECKTLPLISQSRRLVREGHATELRDTWKDIERNIYLHLFNDYLLVSLRKEGGKFTVIDHAPVSDLRVEDCKFKLHSLRKNLFQLHMVNKALLLRTDTEADKKRWISALSRPYPEIDFSAVQDFKQVQCIKAYAAQQPDELNLEKADVLLVHDQSSDGWVEVTRLSDRQRGWAPDSHVETIVSDKTKKRNLLDTMKIATAAM